MSELMNGSAAQGNFRRRLLMTASVLALLVSGAYEAEAADGDADRSPIWIELGGQFDQLNAGQTPWSPPPVTFASQTSPPLDHPAPTSIGATPSIGFDADAKLSFEPNGSDWIYSIALRYGRASRGPKLTKDQSVMPTAKYGFPTTQAFVDTSAETTERHMLLDFRAGKDVGLGMNLAQSVVSFGVRIAQFSSRLNAHINSEHRYPVTTGYGGHGGNKYPAAVRPFGDADIRHSFIGVGPSISWDASAPVLGSRENGFSLDWNANAAVLFGRQKTVSHIATNDTANFYSASAFRHCTARAEPGVNCLTADFVNKVVRQSDVTSIRNKQALVPNIGGLVGVSYHRGSAKLSLGYRADFFFGALDGGVDAHKSYNRGFFGPFANISVGIGG